MQDFIDLYEALRHEVAIACVDLDIVVTLDEFEDKYKLARYNIAMLKETQKRRLAERGRSHLERSAAAYRARTVAS